MGGKPQSGKGSGGILFGDGAQALDALPDMAGATLAAFGIQSGTYHREGFFRGGQRAAEVTLLLEGATLLTLGQFNPAKLQFQALLLGEQAATGGTRRQKALSAAHQKQVAQAVGAHTFKGQGRNAVQRCRDGRHAVLAQQQPQQG